MHIYDQGTTQLNGEIGGDTPLRSFTIASNVVEIDAPNITTQGPINFNWINWPGEPIGYNGGTGPVTSIGKVHIKQDLNITTLDSTLMTGDYHYEDSGVTFLTLVDGAHYLTIRDQGTTRFNGQVGSEEALLGLDIQAHDVVTTGTWTDAYAVQAGEHWQAEFSFPSTRIDIEFSK
jgi:hypothetical protein